MRLGAVSFLEEKRMICLFWLLVQGLGLDWVLA